MADAWLGTERSTDVNRTKVSMWFERNVTPGLIGLPVEDHKDYYTRLQRQHQVVDTGNSVILGWDMGKTCDGYDVRISLVGLDGGMVTAGREIVFPENKKRSQTITRWHKVGKTVSSR